MHTLIVWFVLQEAPTNADRSMAVEHLVGISGEHGSFMREFERTKNAHWIESQRGSSQVFISTVHEALS